jgi:hypothetical protein
MDVRAEVEQVRAHIAGRHGIRLPPVQLVCSDEVAGGFLCVSAYFPRPIPSTRRREQLRGIRRALGLRGVTEGEVAGLDLRQPVLGLPRRCGPDLADYWGTLYEEVGHEAAYVLGLRNRIANEGFALAWRFKGVLAGVPRGLFSQGAALDRIQRAVNGVRHNLSLLAGLQRVGLKIPPRHYHYSRALFAIQEYNPALTFRGRDPGEVEGELDRSLDYILKVSVRVRRKLAKLAGWRPRFARPR